jgi:hypothetical protein
MGEGAGMKAVDKKAAKAAYKEQDVVAGIYAVRCLASGQVWVGHVPNLGKIENRLWFMLRQGDHPSRALQEAWRTHGSDSFAFEELERLAEEDIAYVRATQLKQRAAHWRGKLNASPI